MKNTVISLLLGILLYSCNKDDTIRIGQETTEGFSVLDTFRIAASTIMLDSLPTSGTGSLMIGRLQDPEFGNIEASTYFPLHIPEIAYPDLINSTSARFDSVTLKIKYSGRTYGDTALTAGFSVFQLAEELELIENNHYEASIITSTNALYNNSSVKYSTSPLGSITFKPKPKSADSIRFKLNNSFGQNLYQMIRNKDERLTEQDRFTEYFKGLALVPDQQSGNCVVNFNSTTTALQLFYSENNEKGIRTAKSIDFKLTDSTLQFNKIQADRSRTNLKNIAVAKTKLDYKDAGNKCFVQGGTGIVTRLQFPTLLAFLNQTAVAVNKADLIIELPKPANNLFELPPNLVLFVADKNNRPQSTINNFYSDGVQYATLQKNYDNDITGKVRYVFNLTEYVANYKKQLNNTENSLLLSVPMDRLYTSLERVVTGSPTISEAKIKLNIMYTKYEIPD